MRSGLPRLGRAGRGGGGLPAPWEPTEAPAALGVLRWAMLTASSQPPGTTWHCGPGPPMRKDTVGLWDHPPARTPASRFHPPSIPSLPCCRAGFAKCKRDPITHQLRIQMKTLQQLPKHLCKLTWQGSPPALPAPGGSPGQTGSPWLFGIFALDCQLHRGSAPSPACSQNPKER